MDRGRDRRSDIRGDGEVTKMGGGESYRPSARPRSPRTDTFRSDRDRDRSPRRERARTPIRERARTPIRDRARTPPPSSDSYYPSARDRSPRRRSRTPLYRARERTPPRDVPNWRTRERARTSPRARSPPRRFSPRDNDRRERARSPRRDDFDSRDKRRRSRSPYDCDRPAPRARSPLSSRRSPPAGPRGARRARSRSLDRRGDRIPTGPSSATWRRRSPSPAPRDSGRSSGRTSGDTSRRSSPPIHPSRIATTQSSSRDERPRARSPDPRDRSPPTQATSLTFRDSTRDSARSTPRERSQVRFAPPQRDAFSPRPRSPPRGPAGLKAPTGPSSARNFTAPARSPVQTSSSATPVSMSAHNRPENAGPLVPPAGPRGYVPLARGSTHMRGNRGTFGSDRTHRPDTTSWGGAPPSRPAADAAPTWGGAPASRPAPSASPTTPTVPTTSTGIPTGPRASSSSWSSAPSRPALQSSSSAYSRTQQFNNTPSQPRVHPAMANLPAIIPGGRINPAATGIPSDIAARLKKREEEEVVLRADLTAKEEKLRKNMKIWDKMQRESDGMGLRSELSERHVRLLAGEGVGGAAF